MQKRGWSILRQVVCCAFLCATSGLAFVGAASTESLETCGEPGCCESEALTLSYERRLLANGESLRSSRVPSSLRRAASRAAARRVCTREAHPAGHRLSNGLPAPLRC